VGDRGQGCPAVASVADGPNAQARGTDTRTGTSTRASTTDGPARRNEVTGTGYSDPRRRATAGQAAAPRARVRTRYRFDVAVTASVSRSGPPKARLATRSGTRTEPSRTPGSPGAAGA